MSDILQHVHEFGLREDSPDPLQREYRELRKQRAQIDQRITRVRVTKIFCSQKCNIRYSDRHRENRAVDTDLIRKHLVRIKRSGMMAERTFAIAHNAVYRGETYEVVGERYGVSRQRVLQALQRAHKAALLIESIVNEPQPEPETVTV